MDLKNRVAVVTGGAMGLGEGIAKALAEAGATVAITDVNTETGTQTAAALASDSAPVVFFEHDVTSWDSSFAMAAAVESRLGPIAILVNNAGVSKQVPFLEMSEAEWDRLLDINLKGHFLTCRAVIPRMLEHDYGRIVNMSSICGKQGQPTFSHYCTSKFGIIGLTQSLAMEFAKTGITVNAVCPGSVATPLHDKLVQDMATAAGMDFDEAMRNFNAIIPQGRAQTTEDVANMVVFLAGENARNMTGGSYHVDGGVRMD